MAAFVGLVGGGKTYHAIKDNIAKQFAAGGLVATNIKLIETEWETFLPRRYSRRFLPDQIIHLDNEQVMEFWRHVPRAEEGSLPVMIVIDEASEYLDATMMRTEQTKEFLSYLRQSRKCGQDVIFISQDLSFLDKRIRRMVAKSYTFRDLSTCTIPVLQIKYPFNKFAVNEWDRDGKLLLKTTTHWKDPEIYVLYDTRETFRDFGNISGKTKFDNKLLEGDDLKTKEKVFLYGNVVLSLALLVVLLDARRSDAALPTASAAPVAPAASGAVSNAVSVVELPEPVIDNIPISVVGGRVYALGQWLHIGKETDYGQVKHASGAMVVCVARGGVTNVFYSRD